MSEKEKAHADWMAALGEFQRTPFGHTDFWARRRVLVEARYYYFGLGDDS